MEITDFVQGSLGFVSGLSPTFNDVLRVDLLFDELVGFSEEFTGKDSNGGGTVTNFFVLSLGDVYQERSNKLFPKNFYTD